MRVWPREPLAFQPSAPADPLPGSPLTQQKMYPSPWQQRGPEAEQIRKSLQDKQRLLLLWWGCKNPKPQSSGARGENPRSTHVAGCWSLTERPAKAGRNPIGLGSLGSTGGGERYQPECSAPWGHQGHRMNASEKNKKRNKNYNIRPKENEEKKEKKSRCKIGSMNPMTASYKNYDTRQGGARGRLQERRAPGHRPPASHTE